MIRTLVAAGWHQHVHTGMRLLCITGRAANKNPDLDHIGPLHPASRIFPLRACGRKTHDRDSAIEGRPGRNSSLLTVSCVRELQASHLDCITKEKGRLGHNALIVRDPRTIAYHNPVELLILEGDRTLPHLISIERVTLFQFPLHILDLLPGLLYGRIGRSSRPTRHISNRVITLVRSGELPVKNGKEKINHQNEIILLKS